MGGNGEAGRVKRKRRNDPDGVRARILDAAFELFQSQGYTGTSVHEIAAAAGVTGGALHHHFPLKKGIGLAVIEERVARALEETWLEPMRTSDDPRTSVLDIFERLAAEIDDQAFVRGCPVNNLALELAFADDDFRKPLQALFDHWRSELAGRLGNRGKSMEMATMIVACYSGAMALAKAEQRSDPLRLCANELAALF